MKTKKIIGYKFIREDMKSKEGNCIWKLGEWKHKDEIKLCEKGLHACRTPLQSLEYVYGDKWFIVEAKGKIEEKELNTAWSAAESAAWSARSAAKERQNKELLRLIKENTK